MKLSHNIIVVCLFLFLLLSLTACNIDVDSNTSTLIDKSDESTENSGSNNSNEMTVNDESVSTFKYDNDQLLFLEISISTTEAELQSLADKYNYHLDLTRYNAGNSNRDREENYVYELYNPTQFRNETEEKWRTNKQYNSVKITFYHSNDENDSQNIVKCEYCVNRSAVVVQTYDTISNSATYSYYNKITNVPAQKDSNWHDAESSQNAMDEYLSK